MVDAVRCAIEVQNGLIERNAGLPPERRIDFRVGIHLGDMVEEVDGDLMGDGVNIAARLESIAEPGAICLSEDAYRQVKARLDLGCDRSRPSAAQEHRRAGSGLFARSRPAGAPAKPASPSAALRKISTRRVSPSSFSRSPISAEIRITNPFVDGVTESLTTDLSRIRGSFVIARHTAFTYKGKAIDLKQIGRELGVRYVLEGSILRSGERMRINAQLVDAETGAHLWAERFDKPVADLFATQDEIVARLAGQLDAAIVSAEARRAERSPHPDSWTSIFAARPVSTKATIQPSLRRAQVFLFGSAADRSR